MKVDLGPEDKNSLNCLNICSQIANEHFAKKFKPLDMNISGTEFFIYNVILTAFQLHSDFRKMTFPLSFICNS